jgi:hypothetical protein
MQSEVNEASQLISSVLKNGFMNNMGKLFLVDWTEEVTKSMISRSDNDVRAHRNLQFDASVIF